MDFVQTFKNKEKSNCSNWIEFLNGSQSTLLLRRLVCFRRVLISANTYPLKQTKHTFKYVTKSLFLLYPRKPREKIVKLHFSRGIHARRTSSDHVLFSQLFFKRGLHFFLLFYQHYGIWRLLFRTETFLKLNNEVNVKQKHGRLETRKRNGEEWGTQK